ncbi:MAG: DUF262 domain-containing HNH endonuclease family protein, partial [Saprospiraceae bacterium]|nr:DUF262 domain-containing HNH endonuclease family protein [Saprospiraceae bacterium]
MDLEPTIKTVETLINSRRKYKVPVYQRDYSWTKDERGELWNDIYSAWKNNEDYFLGCILDNKENFAANGNFFEVIDGQQRLCTIVTLFCVIRDIARHYIAEPSKYSVYGILDDADNKDNATDICAIASNVIGCPRRGYNLELNNKDQPIFLDKVLTTTTPDFGATEPNRRVQKAKYEFTKLVLENFIEGKSKLKNLHDFTYYCHVKLLFLENTVSNDIDAYSLFESLNDRGLDLSISDLVKNLLIKLCGSDNIKKDRIINKWNELVGYLDQSRIHVQEYLRLYWSAFYENSTKKNLYKKIKEVLSKPGTDHEQILCDWSYYAEYFADWTNKDRKFTSHSITGNPGDFEYTCSELNEIGYTVYLPFFLITLKHKPVYLEKIAPICLNYLFRLITIGNLSAGTAEQTFKKAIEMVKDGQTEAKITREFTSDSRVSDNAFKKNIVQKQFDNASAKYFLKKVHLKDNPSIPTHNSAQLEHVLPQNVDAPSWTSFSAGGLDRNIYIFNIGNCTLLEKTINAAAKDLSLDKKIIDHYVKKSTKIPMTKAICDAKKTGTLTNWDTNYIQKRAKEFAEKAVDIWPMSTSSITGV